MSNNKLILYEQVVNNTPLYFRKIFSVIGLVVFTTTVLYMFYFTAIMYETSYFSVLKAPYFERSIMSLWVFYSFNLDLLLIIIVSLCYLTGGYILGWLGVVNPEKQNVFKSMFYNLLISLVVFSFCLLAKNYKWYLYSASVLICTLVLTLTQNKAISNENNRQNNIKDKVFLYIILLFCTPCFFFFLFSFYGNAIF